MPLTKELLMGLCDYAGVHVYSRSYDVFGANASYIMLHTTNAGNKKINLPAKYDVKEIFSGKTVGKDITDIREYVPGKATRIYQITN